MPEHLLACQELTRRYGRKKALDGLTLAIQPGEVYGLAGPNGAGKTTFLSLACGLLRPSSGTVWILGQPPVLSLRAIGPHFQTRALYPNETVMRNIRFLAVAPERVRANLERLGITAPELRREVRTLSYGQQQRVGLAISLAKPAKVFLLDEPGSGLDHPSARELQAMLRELVSAGAAAVVASHEWVLLNQACDRVGILLDGKLERELRAREETRRSAFLLVTDPRISAPQLRIPLITEARARGEGRWELDLPAAEAASEVMSRLLENGIPVVEWRPLAVTENWQRVYQELLARREHPCAG
ncbi:MAG: ABC transporter ATP-binding protein [bacterium]|nr:ABC transporter ATP-binding protein [bacterium]